MGRTYIGWAKRWYGSGSPIVTMMQPAQSIPRKEAPRGCGANSVVRGSLPQPKMRAVLVVVADVFREQRFQMAFIHRNDVIQQISSAAFNPTLRHSILPRAFEGCSSFHSRNRFPGGFEGRRANVWLAQGSPHGARSRRRANVGRARPFIQREIVLSQRSKPSMRSSPWMRGAPQVGFSTTIRKINSRTSFGVGFLPTRVLTWDISLQYERKPAWCQRTTVSGVTTIRACFHPDQNRLTATQNSLSNGLRPGR